MEARFERLYDDKIDGQITEEFYNTRLQQYTKEKDATMRQLAQYADDGTENTELVRNLFELSQRAKDIYASSKDIEKKKLILKFIYKKVALDGQKVLVTEYTEAFRFLVEIINFTNGSNIVLFEKSDPKKFEPSDFVSSKGKSDPEWVAFNFVLRAMEEVRTSILSQQRNKLV